MKPGLSEQEALNLAAQKIGQAGVLGNEFKKNETTLMKKIMIIAAGIFGVLFGPGIILPALARYRHQGTWNGEVVVPILAGVVITLVGASMAVYGFRRRQA